jgi:hypothetical protein
MMEIANTTFHHTVLSRVINCPEIVEAWFYHQIYWRIDDSCLAARHFLLMPLCFQLRRQVQAVTSPIDYGFLPEVCPGGRYAVLQDSDDFLMLELQEPGTQADLLRAAQKLQSGERALERKLSEIAANASAWATAEHMRAARHTLIFHSRELPTDIEQKLADFNSRMDCVLTQMPPPVPSVRHIHWLGAVHAYRSVMSQDGANTYPHLLADDLNRIYKLLSEPALAEMELLDESQADHMAIKYFQAASIIIAVDNLAFRIRRLSGSTRFFTVSVDQLSSMDAEVQFVFPRGTQLERGATLGIYVGLELIGYLGKFEQLFSMAVDAGVQIVLFFRPSQKYINLSWPENSSILCALQYLFPSIRYRAELEMLPAPDLDVKDKAASVTESMEPNYGTALHEAPLIGFVVRLFRANRGPASLANSAAPQ